MFSQFSSWCSCNKKLNMSFSPRTWKGIRDSGANPNEVTVAKSEKAVYSRPEEFTVKWWDKMEVFTQEVLLLHFNAANTYCSYLMSAKLLILKYFIITVKNKQKLQKQTNKPYKTSLWSQWRKYFSPSQNMKCAGTILPSTTPNVTAPYIMSTGYSPTLHRVGNLITLYKNLHT